MNIMSFRLNVYCFFYLFKFDWVYILDCLDMKVYIFVIDEIRWWKINICVFYKNVWFLMWGCLIDIDFKGYLFY